MTSNEDLAFLQLVDGDDEILAAVFGCKDDEPSKRTKITYELAQVISLIYSNGKDDKTLKGYQDLFEKLDDHEFFQQFRVSRKTFDLIHHLVFDNGDIVKSSGQKPLDNRLRLMLGLWYLGHQCTYAEIAKLFGLCKSSVFHSVNLIVDKIASLSTQFIKWPSITEIQKIEDDFFAVAGFPSVIGAIDGCHIRIRGPIESPKDYFDRTSNHSVTLMAVCSAEQKFTYIHPGFPGSADDQRVFECTQLGQSFETEPLSYCYDSKSHLIGDSDLALKSYMMVPFKDDDSLADHQLHFNASLSKSWHVIEDAFWLLKGRFQKLKYIDADVNRISKIITAACVLHNVCVEFSEEVPTFDEPDDSLQDANEHSNLCEIDDNAKKKRDAIAKQLIR